MEFAVRHFIPGRIRLCVPALCQRRSLAEAMLDWLRRQSGVKSARINYDCASLVVEYDRAHEALFRTLIGRLRFMNFDELRRLIGVADAAGARSADFGAGSQGGVGRSALRNARRSCCRPFPWRSPSAPIRWFKGINLPLMLWNAYPIALRAWRVFRREGRLNIDFLDTLAVAASLALGNPLAGAIVIWLIKLGDWIRDLTAAGSRRAISELLEFQSKKAWVVRDGAIVSIPAIELSSPATKWPSSIPAR